MHNRPTCQYPASQCGPPNTKYPRTLQGPGSGVWPTRGGPKISQLPPLTNGATNSFWPTAGPESQTDRLPRAFWACGPQEEFMI